ncbi:diphthine--ammonia ligase [Candidatus Woesearchaeota archaeon]|nr:diphthine--ammonia ligase [Candidatus Woesearchaeota archaeon]
MKLGVLSSGGKDGLYSAYVMKKQNYELSCIISIKSRNPDSFMFHTPNIHLSELQAEAMGLPILVQETAGEKEEELTDLTKAIEKAKKDFHIEGIVVGAIFSNYQRERVEKVCDKFGLKIFAPLWHKSQEDYIRELIKNDFRVIITAIAAEGLDRSFLGKEIDENLIKELIIINKKNKMNLAGEGGEYESLVLDCPLFKKKIIVEKAEILTENAFTGRFIIQKALLDKSK